MTGVDTVIPQLPGPRKAWLRWILYSVLAGWSCGAHRDHCVTDGNSSCLYGVPSLPTPLLHSPPVLSGTFPKGSTATGVLGSASGNPHQDRMCVHGSVCACVCVCVCCVCTCMLVWLQGWVEVGSCGLPEWAEEETWERRHSGLETSHRRKSSGKMRPRIRWVTAAWRGRGLGERIAPPNANARTGS